MSTERCFMCAKSNYDDELKFVAIDSCKVPASQKHITSVLQHLANCIKTKLIFQPGAAICSECYRELTEYDELMLNLLTFQKRLTQKLKDVISTKFEIIEVENELTQIEEDYQLADAANPELDTKEEFIDTDNVMEEVSTDISDDDNDDMDEDGSSTSDRRRNRQECVVCGTTFRSKLLLQNHISEVHNTKVYTCTICGAVRRDEEYLELHMNIHEGKTENECRFCPKRFSRRVNTLRHMRKHWDKKKYQCEKCGERFSLDNMLYNHRMRHEAEENPLICSVCNQSFKSRKTFNHHVLIHQENRPRHHCTMCSKSFTERYTLKMHMKTHGDTYVPVATQEEECKEAEAAVHTLVGNATKDITCVICSIKFENKEMLEQHLQCDHDVILNSA